MFLSFHQSDDTNGAKMVKVTAKKQNGNKADITMTEQFLLLIPKEDLDFRKSSFAFSVNVCDWNRRPSHLSDVASLMLKCNFTNFHGSSSKLSRLVSCATFRFHFALHSASGYKHISMWTTWQMYCFTLMFKTSNAYEKRQYLRCHQYRGWCHTYQMTTNHHPQPVHVDEDIHVTVLCLVS